VWIITSVLSHRSVAIVNEIICVKLLSILLVISHQNDYLFIFVPLGFELRASLTRHVLLQLEPSYHPFFVMGFFVLF
jgi:hypothetical protein